MKIVVVLDDHARTQLCGWNRHSSKTPWLAAFLGRAVTSPSRPTAISGTGSLGRTLPPVKGRGNVPRRALGSRAKHLILHGRGAIGEIGEWSAAKATGRVWPFSNEAAPQAKHVGSRAAMAKHYDGRDGPKCRKAVLFACCKKEGSRE